MPGNRPSILILDDDEIILIALQETLSSEGYKITTTASAHQAIKLLKEESFSVIVSDQRMAEMTGLEFLQQAKKIQPEASRILITGVLTLKTVISAINEGEIYRFIAKPWLRNELLETIRNAHQAYQKRIASEKLRDDALRLNQKLSQENAELQKQLRLLKQENEAISTTYNALNQNFKHSLELCYRIVDAYHPLLGSDTKAIVKLCEQMINCGPFNEKEKHTLMVSAWLNNIGLIGISRELFIKARETPDALEEDERRLIHSHPVYGQTLANFVDTLEDTGITIRAHHEHWDGTGYPDRISGESIPKMARYLAIAVYYVESCEEKTTALENILEQSGTRFEPEAVRLFMKATQLIPLPKHIREVLFSELKPGMQLAKGIYSPTGLLLIPEGEILTDAILHKIQTHNMVDPIHQRLLVYQS